jgi:hypothetical protein
MCEGAPSPFAVGVLGLPSGQSAGQRRQSRLELALCGYKLGYFVIDIVEVGGPPPDGAADPSGYRLVEALATQTDADAFVVRGPIDLPELQRVAQLVRAVIRFPVP